MRKHTYIQTNTSVIEKDLRYRHKFLLCGREIRIKKMGERGGSGSQEERKEERGEKYGKKE
jgi:hypothetical protein